MLLADLGVCHNLVYCGMYKIPFDQKFNTSILKTESCWIWTGYGNGIGYGKMTFGNKRIYAHRYSYSKYKGEIPKGMNVLHSCDNPSCVNPSHLFLGTQKNNIDDMKKKMRMSEGTKHPISKITSVHLMAIRREYANLLNHWSKKLNVTTGTIRNAITLKTYKLSDFCISTNPSINTNRP
jgi:hypothetical protein